MSGTKEQREATHEQQGVLQQPGTLNKPASEGEQAEQADAQEQNWAFRPEELSDSVTFEASARASELRVDECTAASTEQGESKVRRIGLPPTGAKPNVTYRNVQVSIEVKAGPPRRTRSR